MNIANNILSILPYGIVSCWLPGFGTQAIDIVRGNHGRSAGSPVIGVGGGTPMPIENDIGWEIPSGTRYIEVPDDSSLDITAEITLCAWIAPTSVSGWGAAITKGIATAWSTNNYTLGHRPTGLVDFRFGTSGLAFAVAGNELVANKWHFITGVASAGTTNAIRVQVNGNFYVVYGNRSGNPTVNTSVLKIGTDAATGGDPLTGAIAMPMVFNRAVSLQEVDNLYRATKDYFAPK